MENKQKAIMTGIIALLIIALVFCIMIIGKYERDTKALEKENQRLKDSITEEVGNDTTIVPETPEEDEIDPGPLTQEEEFEKKQDIIERTLKMYGLSDNGIELLYTEDEDVYNACLFLFDAQRDVDELFVESSETVTINGTAYKLYTTSRDYEDYEKAVEELVTKDMFEKYFTKSAKNIGGKLYIASIVTGKETEKFTVKELKQIDNNNYEVTYLYKNGETEEERTTKVSFTENEDGLEVISQIEL